MKNFRTNMCSSWGVEKKFGDENNGNAKVIRNYSLFSTGSTETVSHMSYEVRATNDFPTYQQD